MGSWYSGVLSLSKPPEFAILGILSASFTSAVVPSAELSMQ